MTRGALALALAACALVGCGPGMGSIGANMVKQHTDGRLIVREVPQGMEASKAGIEVGDEILSINGRDVHAMDKQEVHDALVGPVGTTVQLTVVRGDEVLRLTVRRGPLRDEVYHVGQ